MPVQSNVRSNHSTSQSSPPQPVAAVDAPVAADDPAPVDTLSKIQLPVMVRMPAPISVLEEMNVPQTANGLATVDAPAAIDLPAAVDTLAAPSATAAADAPVAVDDPAAVTFPEMIDVPAAAAADDEGSGLRFLSPPGPQREVERLGHRISELASRIQAATCELLVMLREFDRRKGWSGFPSCAHWLSWRTGLAPGAAREHMRVARALGGLPRLGDAMRRGIISYSKVRAVTRVATPENEQTLLDVALAGTATHVEQIARAWRRLDRNEEAADDRQRQDRRVLRTWVDSDGMVEIHGRLTPEVGAVVRRALEATMDEERRAAGRSVDKSDPVDDAAGMAPSFGQQQADALGMLAERALGGGGLDHGSAGDRYQVVVHVDAGTLAETDDADVPAGTLPLGPPRRSPAAASPHTAAAHEAPASGTPSHGAAADAEGADVPAGTSQPQSRHAPHDAPARGPESRQSGHAGGSGVMRQAALEEGGSIHVSAINVQRLACDAATVVMRHGADGQVLDVGRKTRTISPALRRALAARDRHCRFPGCQARRCDAHHVQHWAHGGATALTNLMLLCRRHHRAVHEEGFRVTVDADGTASFTRPDGRLLPGVPESPVWSGWALEPTNRRLAADGIAIDGTTSAQLWRGERLDLGWAMSVLWRPRSGTAEDPSKVGDTDCGSASGEDCGEGTGSGETSGEVHGTGTDRDSAPGVAEASDVPAGTPDP